MQDAVDRRQRDPAWSRYFDTYRRRQRELYHRALAAQSILVVNPESKLPRIQLFNWQTARREHGRG